VSKKLIAPFMAVAVIGASGLALIKTHEGLRTAAYADPVGIPTVCYGHTGSDIQFDRRYTPAECDRILINDVAAHQIVLLPGSRYNCIGNVPLNQNQLDALTSFTFNVGTSKFCKSTMARRLLVKDYRGAAAEFPKWANATVGGRPVKLPGLIKRRAAEKTLFETASTRAVPWGATAQLRAVLTTS
jgi:lysozyme